jgi:hypothetical protein
VTQSPLTPEECTSGLFKPCFASTLAIPGIFGPTTTDPSIPYLQITLRVDASTIKPGTKIENVWIQYISDPDPVTGVVTMLQASKSGMCVNGAPTAPKTPCILSYTQYKTGGNVPTELQGDYEWVFLNDRNGSYRLP